MRLILKDYLLQLKEKDELDLLLCDVLLQMGYNTDNKPKTGNRQYGVDIRAHSNTELLLCIVKQGALTRKVWDTDQNAVRQSLNEIHDCYLDLIQGEDREKQLRIVVATNGMLDEAVRPNWEGYIRQNTIWNGKPITIELWNIDSLVDKVQKHLFDEHVFDEQLQSMIRRALYFMDESTYNRSYFEKIVSTCIGRLDKTDSQRRHSKKLAGLHLASQMIAQYAADAQFYKVAVEVSEYLILQYWNYLRCTDQMENAQEVPWVYKFVADYLRWSKEYYEVVRSHCERENGIPAYTPLDQRLLIYEVLGYLSTYAYTLSFQSNEESKKECTRVVNSIIHLLNNHPQFHYPVYDCNINVVGMVCRLMMRCGRVNDACAIIDTICRSVMLDYQIFGKYPTATDRFEDAVNIHMGFSAEPYETSAFWGTMLLWISLLNQKNLYCEIQPFLKDDLSSVTACTWFLRAEDEAAMYDAQTMHCAGDGIALDVEMPFDKFQAQTTFILEQYAGEKFSYDEYSFSALEFIACRYFGTLPRVRLEEAIG